MRRSRFASLVAGAIAIGASVSAKNAAGPIHVPSPDWRDQIIYSLMIDRFEDGDKTRNDQGKHEFDPRSDAFFSGGDLKGITERIPYLKQLGVTAVWISPPTATQWWDPTTSYSGYHGYWPVNFRKVDAHFGSLADYRTLARTLHGNGMYLVQDAVVNQIGHYYDYAGGYHPEDNRINFHLAKGAIPPRPTMYPFNLVDRLNPRDAAANVYHWTPSITDYADPSQRFTWQLQLMNDINTSSPLVRRALKSAYGYWIRRVGVDAFRLDAAKHVELDFWRDFLHGPGGIEEAAAATGRRDFFTFGEVFNFSDPFRTNGEDEIGVFTGTRQDPVMSAVINFPLYDEVRRVFADGMPTRYLAYRLSAQAGHLGDPDRTPTFVDNHDVQRFLAGATSDAYHQAYALVMTARGIPVIYQGDEQDFIEPRRAMFRGGFHSAVDAFDTTSATFRFLQQLTTLRRSQIALRRGTLAVLRDNPTAAGVLAFRRQWRDKTDFVILNTSGTHASLLNAMPTGMPAGTTLETLFADHRAIVPPLSPTGDLTMVLPPHATLVLAAPAGMTANAGFASPSVDDRPFRVSGERLCGRMPRADAALRLVIDGDLNDAATLGTDPEGRWCATLPATGLDPAQATAEVYSPASATASPPITYMSAGSIRYRATIADPAGDDRGPTGRYTLRGDDDPAHHAADIRGVTIRANDDVLELGIQMGEISNVWNYVNHFDHVAFSIFIGDGSLSGKTALPELNASMPAGGTWLVAHRLFGMGSAVYSADGASSDQSGRRLDAVPSLSVDYAGKRITIRYDRRTLGIDCWAGKRFYVSTWDADQYNVYRPIGAVSSPAQLGGGTATSPRILDDVAFSIPMGTVGTACRLP